MAINAASIEVLALTGDEVMKNGGLVFVNEKALSRVLRVMKGSV